MRFEVITIFPGLFECLFTAGVLKKAVERGILQVRIHDLRDYTTDKHRQVDDRPYGGLEGMVLKPEPIFRAVEAIREPDKSVTCLLTPQGERFDSRLAEKLAGYPQVILICGRYEGVDKE